MNKQEAKIRMISVFDRTIFDRKFARVKKKKLRKTILWRTFYVKERTGLDPKRRRCSPKGGLMVTLK
jgi:hypothetical protein